MGNSCAVPKGAKPVGEHEPREPDPIDAAKDHVAITDLLPVFVYGSYMRDFSDHKVCRARALARRRGH